MVKLASTGFLPSKILLPELQAYRRSSTTQASARHSREGKEPFSYYWTTHFLPHDSIPRPTYLREDHPTAPLHDLVASWHCVKHEYVSRPRRMAVSRKNDASVPPPPTEEERRTLFETIRKNRTAALKLYRRLDRTEADHYLKALQHSPERVWSRPSSPARPAGITAELARLLEQPEYRQRWQLQRLEGIDTGSEDTHETTSFEREVDEGSCKLVKDYRFDKLEVASNFMRLACRVMGDHDHHPQLLMQFLPDARMFQVRINTWTHTPRALPNPDHTPFNPSKLDEDFARVTTVNRYFQTVLSDPDTRPIIRKTIPAPPGLTRKDFLLAWDLDGAEIQTRSRSIALARKGEKWAVKVAAAKANEGTEGTGRDGTVMRMLLKGIERDRRIWLICKSG